MLIYGLVTRGSNVVAEYGIVQEGFSGEVVTIIVRNKNVGTRLVPMGDKLCAVMNKLFQGEIISFACIIEGNEERDTAFNFLDSVASFFERESSNPKMKSEMNSFLSRQLKFSMVAEPHLTSKGKGEHPTLFKRSSDGSERLNKQNSRLSTSKYK
jgi:hypothetical protein